MHHSRSARSTTALYRYVIATLQSHLSNFSQDSKRSARHRNFVSATVPIYCLSQVEKCYEQGRFWARFPVQTISYLSIRAFHAHCETQRDLLNIMLPLCQKRLTASPAQRSVVVVCSKPANVAPRHEIEQCFQQRVVGLIVCLSKDVPSCSENKRRFQWGSLTYYYSQFLDSNAHGAIDCRQLDNNARHNKTWWSRTEKNQKDSGLNRDLNAGPFCESQ